MATPHLKQPTSKNTYKIKTNHSTIKYQGHKIAQIESQCMWMGSTLQVGQIQHLKPQHPKVKCGWALAWANWAIWPIFS